MKPLKQDLIINLIMSLSFCYLNTNQRCDFVLSIFLYINTPINSMFER